MKREATLAGSYHSTLWNKDYAKIQLLSIKELLEGKKADLPAFVAPTYQIAPKVKATTEQPSLFGGITSVPVPDDDEDLPF
jgi:hypothetical protein